MTTVYAERQPSPPDAHDDDADAEPHGDDRWVIISNQVYDEYALLSEIHGVITLRNLGHALEVSGTPWRQPITDQLIAGLDVKHMQIFNGDSLAQYLRNGNLRMYRYQRTNYYQDQEPEDIWV